MQKLCCVRTRQQFSASLDYFVTSSPPYLHQFSTISGGNCIKFINTLSDNIRKWGAMDTLISDGGKYEISKRVTDLLHSLFIQDYQSEPYHQHQNKAENCFGLAKRYTYTVMNTSGCPACCWLLCFAVHLRCTQPLGISYSPRHMPCSSFARIYPRC